LVIQASAAAKRMAPNEIEPMLIAARLSLESGDIKSRRAAREVGGGAAHTGQGRGCRHTGTAQFRLRSHRQPAGTMLG
jgi:hypothetical protein